MKSQSHFLDKIRQSIQENITVKQEVLRDQADDIAKAAEMLIDCVQKGHKVIFFGNGGSASDSQHLAAEFVGRYEKERRALPAIALTTDTSILTAVGNDYGFDKVFSRQIEALGQPGDVVVALSTSGNSPNVLLGVEKAKAMGLATIGFAGGSGGKLKAAVDLPLVVPSHKTSRIQETHILIGHILCECVDAGL